MNRYCPADSSMEVQVMLIVWKHECIFFFYAIFGPVFAWNFFFVFLYYSIWELLNLIFQERTWREKTELVYNHDYYFS